MEIWNKVQNVWQNWHYPKKSTTNKSNDNNNVDNNANKNTNKVVDYSEKDLKQSAESTNALENGNKNNSLEQDVSANAINEHETQLDLTISKTQVDLTKLIKEPALSKASKEQLKEDLAQLNRIIDKLANKHFHLSVFGRVSVGKSSLLNCLMASNVFSTSVLHGETKASQDVYWQTYENYGLIFVDTPGIDEISGESRANIAKQTALLSDLILFVIDGDMQQIEFEALLSLQQQLKSIIIVINKCDRFSQTEQQQILQSLTEKMQQYQLNYPICFVAADPRAKTVIRIDENNLESEYQIYPSTNIEELKQLIWNNIKTSGKSLQLMSSALFTSQISDRMAHEIIEMRRDVANQIIHKYCIAKALAVGLNPVPLLDLTVLFGDIAMIKHLGSVYGFELTYKESRQLLSSILTEMLLVLGSSYGVAALSSTLKGFSAGLSTILTASTQGLATYYGTYLVGQATEVYFKQGASWGELGAKTVLNNMAQQIDKQSVLNDAKSDLERILKAK